MTREYSHSLLPDDHIQIGTSDDSGAIYRIGDLAREFNVTLRTLRFYEDKGLVTPRRNGTTRLYNDDDRSRLKLILFSKRVGFSLMEIRELLALYDSGQGSLRNPLSASRHLFKEKLAALELQKIEMENAIEELSSQLSAENGMFSD